MEIARHEVIAAGAEAILIRGVFLGIPSVFKVRKPKGYRLKELDEQLRRHRTMLEAKIMRDAKQAGVLCPAVLYVDLDEATIVMEHIPGLTLRNTLSSKNTLLLRDLGAMIGKLHSVGIIHGDLTTSNVILSRGRLYLIDFGLSFYSNRIEDQGEDIHLLYRCIDSTHPNIYHDGVSLFNKGYTEVRGAAAAPVLKRAGEIYSRGRYRA